MEKKKTTKKTTTKSNKKTTVKPKKTVTSKKSKSRKKNKKGFTLIELLAVIIILGVLMIIAIPSVTTYISNSRKSSYVDTVKNIVGAARNLVNSGKLETYDRNTTYYIPISCLPTENGARTPYGEFSTAYVLVSYNGDGYNYYYTGNDTSKTGIKNVIPADKITEDNIVTEVEDTDIKTDVGVEGKKKIVVFNDKCNDRSEEINAATVIDKDGNEIKQPKSFATDDWSTVINAIRNNDTDAYNIGDIREIDMGSLGVHNIRIVNKSTPSECNDSNYSQTSCGFVVELTDVIGNTKFDSSTYNTSGYGYSDLRTYLNGTVYDSLPSEIKESIINTQVVYGLGIRANAPRYNKVVDKVFALSAKEIMNTSNGYDMADPYVRQLDYYSLNANYNSYKKKKGNSYSSYWTRSVDSTDEEDVLVIQSDGMRWYGAVDSKYAVAPAFRIG